MRRRNGASSKRSTGSATASRPSGGFDLRLELFLAILGVTLACIIFFAFLSHFLVRREFRRAFQEEETANPRPPEGGGMEPPRPPEHWLRYIDLSYVITGFSASCSPCS